MKGKGSLIVIMILLGCGLTLFAQTEQTTRGLRGEWRSDSFKEFYRKQLAPAKVFYLNSPNSQFQNTYLLNSVGQSLSQGAAPSNFYRPTTNFVVFNGGNMPADSFNPYGSRDVGSALLSAYLNKFLDNIIHKKGSIRFGNVRR